METFNEWLDEIYGEVEIAGMRYPASDVLAAVDPIAYRVMLSDWESEREDEDEPLPWTGKMVEIHSDPDVSRETLPPVWEDGDVMEILGHDVIVISPDDPRAKPSPNSDI